MKAVCIWLVLSSSCIAFPADTQQQLASRAEQLLRQGNRADALATLAEAAAAHAATAESEDKIGFLYAVLQQPSDAQSHLEKAIQADASYAPAHYHLGVLLWNGAQQEQGLTELQSAARLAPKVFDYRYRLGVAYLRLNQPESALAELKEATALNPASAAAWADLGRAFQSNNDLASAVDSLAKALSLDPHNDTLRNSYAFLLIETRQPGRGIEESHKVLAHNPKDTSAMMNIGYAALKVGDFDAAEKAYRQLVATDPHSAAGHYDLGIALKSSPHAEGILRRGLRLDPNNTSVTYLLGQTLMLGGKQDEGRAMLERWKTLDAAQR